MTFKLFVIAHTNRGPGASGVGVNLLRSLSSIGRELEVIPILPVGCGYEDIAESCSLPAIWFDQKGSLFRRIYFDTIILPRRIRSINPHAILALGNIGALNPSVPQAVLVQDAHYVYPSRHYGAMTALQQLRYFVQKRQVRYCLKRSSLLYCQTEKMLQRTTETFKIPCQAKVLSKGISLDVMKNLDNIEPPRELEPYRNKFKLICLTRYNPHKNLESIVKMFAGAGELLKDVVIFLTISAHQHPHAKQLLRNIQKYGLTHQIVNVGPIEPSQIPAYFRNCDALLFPTLLESFSASYLEAMQLKLPILTSDLDFAHEICGPAALYFNPWNAESITEAIGKVQNDANLRLTLVKAGQERLNTIHTMSWETMAQNIVTDLRNLVYQQRV